MQSLRRFRIITCDILCAAPSEENMKQILYVRFMESSNRAFNRERTSALADRSRLSKNVITWRSCYVKVYPWQNINPMLFMAVMVNIRAWLSMLISEWWKLQYQDFFLRLQTIAKYNTSWKLGPCMLSGKNTGSTAKKSNCQSNFN